MLGADWTRVMEPEGAELVRGMGPRRLGAMQGASRGVADTGVMRVAAVPSELMISVDSGLGGGGGLMIRVGCSCLTLSIGAGCRKRVGV